MSHSISPSLPPIYCALDTPDMSVAVSLCETIAPHHAHCGIKLGMEFFNTFGPTGIKEIQDAAPDLSLFVDLKYYDIPNTVAKAVETLSHAIKPAYLNVHASGGLEMMRAAKAACAPNTKLLAVTILTSFDEDGITKAGYTGNIQERVKQLALLTQEAGLDGIVCSAHEITMIRETCNDDFALMVPGIRPAGSDQGDQKRIMTPKDAYDAGANHLVIGRPITRAEDPGAMIQSIIQNMGL